jgi:hypothetical protein
MPMQKIMKGCHAMKAWLGIALVLAGMMVVVSASPISGIQIIAPRDDWAPVDAYSASATVTAVAETTTGSTSIQCTGRCTYKAVYNGTILWAYGKGFTPYEVIEFRLNEVYLGRSDIADANGDVATWFKRSIHSGTYELYAHEAHTGKNSTRLKFVVSLSEPQTTIASTSSSSSTIPNIMVEPPRLVAVESSLAIVVAAAVAAIIVTGILVHRRTTSNRMK